MRHVLAALAAGCTLVAGGVAAHATPPPQAVTLTVAGDVAGKPFRCGESYDGVGRPAARVTPTDFRFYVTGVALIDKRGHATPVVLDQDGLWQQRDVALLDFEDGSGLCRDGNSGLNATVKGRVPKGHYIGVRFKLGLPFDLNHGDATVAASPLDLTAMFWSWQAGYRFLKIDMAGDLVRTKSGQPVGFAVHIGDTGCESPADTQRPSRCANANSISVRFPRFDPRHDVIVADLARLLADTDTTRNAPRTAPGCMSAQDDPDCAAIFSVLGLPFGNRPNGPQTFFQRRAR